MAESQFVIDLNSRIRETERVISQQNETLNALRYILAKEVGEANSKSRSSPASNPATEEIDFKGNLSDVILACVRQNGSMGVRPRDITSLLIRRRLIAKGSNTIYSRLERLKKRGVLLQPRAGLYVLAPAPSSEKTTPRRTLSAAGRKAISQAQLARWAAAKKARK